MGGWTGEERDVIAWDGIIRAKEIRAGSYTINNQNLDINEWTYLNGQDQAVKTTSDVNFNIITAADYFSNGYIKINDRRIEAYLQNGTGGALADGDLVRLYGTASTQSSSTGNLSSWMMAVALQTIAIGGYGWFCIYGVCSVNISAAVTAGALLENSNVVKKAWTGPTWAEAGWHLGEALQTAASGSTIVFVNSTWRPAAAVP